MSELKLVFAIAIPIDCLSIKLGDVLDGGDRLLSSLKKVKAFLPNVIEQDETIGIKIEESKRAEYFKTFRCSARPKGSCVSFEAAKRSIHV